MRKKRWLKIMFGDEDGGGGLSVVTPAPSPAPSPVAKETSTDVQNSKEDEKRRKAAQSGYSSTNLTGGAGLTGAANTAKKTLLGE